MDQVQSVITLHSGKVIEKHILEPCEKDDDSISQGKEGVKPEHCKEKTDSPPVLTFPHGMTKQIKVNHDSEIFETFKQEEIEDKKGTENVVADHLSRLTIDATSNITLIGFLPAHLDTQDKRKFFQQREELLLG